MTVSPSLGGGPTRPLTLAFYLPQYHPIPENDAWWGSGFTDWTNVRKAQPLFPGHYQPHVPAELGYYDLRDPAVRGAQAALALEHGIDAFCYYHYWFHGVRLLERPFDEVLRTGTPSLPFCLCWANEPWTRAWDGGSSAILQPQRYSLEDDRRHIEWLLEAFADPRYLKLDGRPLFLVYRAQALPDPKRTMDSWRSRAQSAGFPDLFLCRVESNAERGREPTALGFDAAVEFQPRARAAVLRTTAGMLARARRFHARRRGRPAPPRLVDYREVVREESSRPDPPYRRFPCIVPGWDNTPRRPWAALVLTDSTPQAFGDWVRLVTDRLRDRPAADRLVFVNAWNEWAEGCHLEPCERWGRGYLEAFASALYGAERS